VVGWDSSLVAWSVVVNVLGGGATCCCCVGIVEREREEAGGEVRPVVRYAD
jgi:hypothetical protein